MFSVESWIWSNMPLFQNCPAGANSTNRQSWMLGSDLTKAHYLSGEKQPSFVIFNSTLDYLQTSQANTVNSVTIVTPKRKAVNRTWNSSREEATTLWAEVWDLLRRCAGGLKFASNKFTLTSKQQNNNNKNKSENKQKDLQKPKQTLEETSYPNREDL